MPAFQALLDKVESAMGVSVSFPQARDKFINLFERPISLESKKLVEQAVFEVLVCFFNSFLTDTCAIASRGHQGFDQARTTWHDEKWVVLRLSQMLSPLPLHARLGVLLECRGCIGWGSFIPAVQARCFC